MKDDHYRDTKSDRKKRRKHHSKKYEKEEEQEENDGRKRKRKKEKGSESSSRHGHHKQDKKRKESRKDSEKVNNSRKKSLISQSSMFLGEIKGSAPVEKLDSRNSFFSYNSHFCVYLYYKKGIRFEELTSKKSHELFKIFVKEYNSGSLESLFYNSTIPPNLLEESKKTKHHWKFQTNDSEQNVLSHIKQGVRNVTEANNESSNTNEAVNHALKFQRELTPVAPNNDQSSLPKTREERNEEKRAHKRFQKHVHTTLEELKGGPTDYGRDRQLERKRENAAYKHAPSKYKEDSMAGMEMTDEDLYSTGGADNDFQAALQRQKNRTAKREQVKRDRMMELQQKEQERKDSMLKMLGLDQLQPGQKIRIAPRND